MLRVAPIYIWGESLYTKNPKTTPSKNTYSFTVFYFPAFSLVLHP